MKCKFESHHSCIFRVAKKLSNYEISTHLLVSLKNNENYFSKMFIYPNKKLLKFESSIEKSLRDSDNFNVKTQSLTSYCSLKAYRSTQGRSNTNYNSRIFHSKLSVNRQSITGNTLELFQLNCSAEQPVNRRVSSQPSTHCCREFKSALSS